MNHTEPRPPTLGTTHGGVHSNEPTHSLRHHLASSSEPPVCPSPATAVSRRRLEDLQTAQRSELLAPVGHAGS